MRTFMMTTIAIFLLFGCNKDESEEINFNVISFKANSNKRNICHNGNVINVNLNAIDAHRSHGDAVDMDGDGFYDIANSCGATDCDDNNFELNENCCSEFSEITLNNNQIYNFSLSETWSNRTCHIECQNNSQLSFDLSYDTVVKTRYTWTSERVNVAFISDKSFCEISCSDIDNYDFCNFYTDSNDACLSADLPPTEYSILIQASDGNYWVVEYLGEEDTQHRTLITLRYRQLTGCNET